MLNWEKVDAHALFVRRDGDGSAFWKADRESEWEGPDQPEAGSFVLHVDPATKLLETDRSTLPGLFLMLMAHRAGAYATVVRSQAH